MSKLERLFAGELPRLVMFDLDGTLIDSVPDLAAAVNLMLEQLERPPVSLEQVRLWVGNGALILVRRVLAGDIDYASVSAEQAQPALQLFLQAYAGESRHSCLYPGVHVTLRALQEKGIRMALVTNKPEQFLPGLLRQHGMDGYFEWVVGGGTLPRQKPDPMGLEWVMQQAGVDAGQSLFVGDSVNDVHAAKAAGVRSVALTYGYNHGQPIAQAGPDCVIDGLLELL